MGDVVPLRGLVTADLAHRCVMPGQQVSVTQEDRLDRQGEQVGDARDLSALR